MSDLGELRRKIDGIDLELIRLLNERAEVAIKVGEIKDRDSRPIYAPEREYQLLRALREKNPGPLPYQSLCSIFREILSASRAVEKALVIACGCSLSRLAARERFGACTAYQVENGADAVFEAVAAGKADMGVVAIEAPSERPAKAAIEAFLKHDLPICGQLWLGHAGRETSRFVVVGKIISPACGDDQTMLLLRFQNQPESLVSVLEELSGTGIRLSLVGGDPSRQTGEGWFFVEADGHQQDRVFQEALPLLGKSFGEVRILGSFPKGEAPV